MTTARPVASRASASSSSPFSFSPWKLYGLVRGLNAPPRRPVAAGLLDDVGDLENLLAALDGAGPGDDAEVAAADLQAAATCTHGRLLLDFGAGHLVRRQDRDHFLHPFHRFQGLLGAVALLAQGGDDGQFRADDDVAAQAQLLDPLDDVLDLLLAAPRLHDDDHGSLSATKNGRGCGPLPAPPSREEPWHGGCP